MLILPYYAYNIKEIKRKVRIMKRLYLTLFLILTLSSCSTTEKKTVFDNEITPPSSQASETVHKDYNEIGAHLVEEIMDKMFGGVVPADNMVGVLGQPVDKIMMKEFERWYYEQDIEADVVMTNDTPMLYNYVYIGPRSDIKTNRGIGIGSAADDVKKEYSDEINQEQTNDTKIVAGEQSLGLIFVIDNNVVTSIFIAVGEYTYSFDNEFNDERAAFHKDYGKIGAQLKADTLLNMFGDDFNPYVVIKVLGEPYKTISFDGFDRWYFQQDVEIDVVTMNDTPTYSNYIYIGPSSEQKTDRCIGIGSSVDEVIKAYEYEINPSETTSEYIIAGDPYLGIIFVFHNDKVTSIFIATGRYNQGYVGGFKESRDTSGS
jgi:outer membrane protein assembly factor BamE (lipoprotein component of BamABCDE complex)